MAMVQTSNLCGGVLFVKLKLSFDLFGVKAEQFIQSDMFAQSMFLVFCGSVARIKIVVNCVATVQQKNSYTQLHLSEFLS